jgi:hypothetical protein
MSSKTNPNDVGGEGGEYAGNVAPSRPAVSTVGPGGNKVDRSTINPTITDFSSQKSTTKPAGPASTHGSGA